MSAEVLIKVRYMKLVEDSMIIHAVCLDDAIKEAQEMPEVHSIINAEYED